MESVKMLLEQSKVSLSDDAVKVRLFVPDMGEFATLNKIYCSFFSIMPPVRVCVAINAKEIGIEVTALKPTAQLLKKCLHVQSFSNWAPACIGPYS